MRLIRFRSTQVMAKVACWTLSALLLIGLAGCSLVTLFYGQLPRIATSWVDDAFELSHEQERDVRKQFDEVLAWHGRVEVPRLVAFLAKAEHLLAEDNGLSAKDVQVLADDFWQFRDTLFEQVYVRAYTLLIALSPDQIEHCRAFLKRQNEKRFAELDDGVKNYSESYVERWVDRIEDWTGNLSKEQMALITADAPASFARESENRKRLLAAQEDFLKLASEMKNHDAAGIPQELWKITPTVKGTDRYHATIALLTGIADQLTEKQITHLKGELNKWKDRLQAIAAAAG